MLTHTDWLVHLERHEDLLREAEKSEKTSAKEIACCETVTA